jgi:hypothetical protein
MKTFSGDFDKFLNKIKSGEHFSLSRWGDGELSILEGKPIDIRWKGDGEFRYDPKLLEYEKVREVLMKAYIYKDSNYYIGIACPCCVGQAKYQYMKIKSGQDEEHLTWANIFVNANYRKTVGELIPELKNHTINLVANKNLKFDKVPFLLQDVWLIGTDAWYADYHIVEEIKKYITENNIKNQMFLFAAGPFANMLTYELWEHSKENTYIDIGSILDPYLQLKITRGYQLGDHRINQVCVW